MNAVLFIIGWFWSFLFASYGYPLIASVGVIALIIAEIFYLRKNDLFDYTKSTTLILFIIPLGIILEMFFIQTGLLTYQNKGLFPPFWIICLYPLFALLIIQNLTPLIKIKLFSFCFGFFAWPLSYFGIYLLDGLKFSYPLYLTWALIGCCAGAFMYLIRYLENVIDKAALKTWNEKDNEETLKFFYDGNCPICDREVCHLKAQSPNDAMQFIDITDADEFTKTRGNLDYETAMKAMHAMDSQGNLIIALDAFAKAYARCHYLVLATLLNIPFLRPILDPLYRLFARNRLLITGRKKTAK